MKGIFEAVQTRTTGETQPESLVGLGILSPPELDGGSDKILSPRMWPGWEEEREVGSPSRRFGQGQREELWREGVLVTFPVAEIKHLIKATSWRVHFWLVIQRYHHPS